MTDFINARIFTCDGKTIENGYIRVKDGKIKAVGDMSRYKAQGDQIDIGGKSIYPGFIDAHTHLGMWEDGLGFEGDDGNESTDPATPHLRALDAVNAYDHCFAEALAAGITTVCTGPGSANPVSGQSIVMKTVQGRIDKSVIKSPAAMKLALGENPKGIYHAQEETPITRMAIAAIIREQFLLAKRYLEDKNSAETEADMPDFDMKLEALIPVIKGELPVHIHCHRRDDIFTAVRLAEEFSFKYTLVHATEGYMCADELAECGVGVMSGPLLCDRSKPELRSLSPVSPGVMSKAGIKTALITDHPVIPIQYLPLCAGLAVREGMDYDSALLAITKTPAELLGVANRVGTLSVGKDADFSVFSADPLTIAAKPDMVYVNGERRI